MAKPLDPVALAVEVPVRGSDDTDVRLTGDVGGCARDLDGCDHLLNVRCSVCPEPHAASFRGLDGLRTRAPTIRGQVPLGSPTDRPMLVQLSHIL